MRLILLGAPGAGKGTQAEWMTKRLNVPSISTGNLLREAMAKETPLGKEAKAFMDAGKLVPDEVVIGMVKRRLSEPDCVGGFIFDGFPRTIPQAEALDAITEIDKVLSIEVPDGRIEARMTERRVCLACGATYHITGNPPQAENVCDKCGGALSVRKDDAPEIVRGRLKTFHEQTEPLKAYYGAQGKLALVDGDLPIGETADLIREALGLKA